MPHTEVQIPALQYICVALQRCISRAPGGTLHTCGQGTSIVGTKLPVCPAVDQFPLLFKLPASKPNRWN